MTRVAVFGAGSWGTAFSTVLADAGNEIALWARREEVCKSINERHENPDYLPGVPLADSISATHKPEEALQGAEIAVLAVPSQSLRENLTGWAGLFAATPIVVSLMKGVELGTCKRMSEVIAEVADVDPARIAVVTGPNLAREIADRQPAASVVACTDQDAARRVQEVCHTGLFRLYTNADVIGCELGGATKNVIALATGAAAGLGFGNNTQATVITRGLAETARLGDALGADPYTFAGLAGLGDLVATCSSPLSRNRTFGERLGRGQTVDEIVHSTRQIAEGVKSCQSILELARRHDVEVPIVEAVAAVVRGDTDPGQMVQSLISRSAKPER